MKRNNPFIHFCHRLEKIARVWGGGVLLSLLPWLTAQAQEAAGYFHAGANLFINGKSQAAKQTLQDGLARYPNDPKMSSLLKEIKDEEQKKQQEKEKQDQEKQQQQQKEQEQQRKEQQQKEQQQKQQQQDRDQSSERREQPKEEKGQKEKPAEDRQATAEKLKQMNLTEEKARMILEAMKNNEVQYLQQRRREKTQKADNNKPDW